ncbi:MAG: hypothetical protein ONB54_13480 [candidate division KSB1 bacterium]|nr:hypothetical protein [candidate division KSB1 bacterium]MDZ7275442.1 hypothetical protein [candidate division KSB1 bacterium]MDZ7351641.1 hypothetical protein [candidate division KSB1 bacterium]MDZ7408103.1 hypothetical protein [candidate division KSB1 bacterium]
MRLKCTGQTAGENRKLTEQLQQDFPAANQRMNTFAQLPPPV